MKFELIIDPNSRVNGIIEGGDNIRADLLNSTTYTLFSEDDSSQ